MHARSGPSAAAGGSTTTVLAPISAHEQQKQIHPPAIDNRLAEAGSNLVRSELGERILESSSAFLQSNFVSRYASKTQYYFQVNDEYVKNKLKMILFPFLHKGHWMREMEVGAGPKFSYKPPISDINAPDLYIPMMAFGTYMVLAGFFLGINGKFSPEALEVQLTRAILCWLLQILLLGVTLHILGGGDIVPLLDLVAYGGYTFIAASVIMMTRILCDHLFCVLALWESFCIGVFMVKTTKRILVSELKSLTQSNKRNYLLLFIAISQIPLLFWLGMSCVKTWD